MLKRFIPIAIAGPLIAAVALVAPTAAHAQEACSVGGYHTEQPAGQDSDSVRCIQQSLNDKGFAAGPVDGWFGPVTEGAVMAFQTAQGITVDGEVGQETAGALGVQYVRAQRQQASNNGGGGSSRSSGGGGGGASGVNWDRVAQCESGQQWGHGSVTNHVGTFSGGLMIMNSAWRQYGGQEFANIAGNATREQQIIVAERIAARVGAARAWQCPVG